MVAAAATISSLADFFGASTGSSMRLLTPQDIAYNQMRPFYMHPLLPWQIPPITYSPPISPIHSIKDNIVTTTTSASIEVNGRDSFSTRKISNFTKNRNQGLYQPYSSLNSSPPGSISSISPGPTSPSNLSGSLSSSIISPSSSSTSSNHCASPKQKGPTSSRDKSFKCQLCHRSFNYKHVLQNHMRTHTGEKPYGCTECGKRFTRDHHLKTHLRLHTGERPYQCKLCNQTFVQVANLRRHMRVHTGKSQQTRQRIFENALSTITLENPNYGVALDLSVETGSKNDKKEFGRDNRKLESDQRGNACEQKSMKTECFNISEDQSEPEDLSMNSSRLDSSTSPSEEDLDDLDDAESLNRKLQMGKQARNNMR